MLGLAVALHPGREARLTVHLERRVRVRVRVRVMIIRSVAA